MRLNRPRVTLHALIELVLVEHGQVLLKVELVSEQHVAHVEVEAVLVRTAVVVFVIVLMMTMMMMMVMMMLVIAVTALVVAVLIGDFIATLHSR